MAPIQFEGDVSGLSEKQGQFIRDVLEKLGFNNNKVLFEPVGKTGDNYAANVKRIIVNNGKEELKIIAKLAPTNETLRSMMGSTAIFKNEITMYEYVFPKFNSLQKSVGVPENEMLKYAKCYGCLSEVPDEVVLLEDLKQSDYVMLDRFDNLDDAAIRLVLKNFALLHSLSFVLKHFEPETFEDYRSRLADIMGALEHVDFYENMMEQTESNAIAVLDDEIYKKAVRGSMTQFSAIKKKAMKNENPMHLIIQQGDAWTNNLMFKVQDGKALESIMIDYQLSQAANPVCDILYMVFNCTDHVSRLKHYHEWMDYYHEELDRSLSNFGLKASLLYTREQLDADLKRYSKSFFAMSVLVNGMVTRTDEEAALAKDAMSSTDIERAGENIAVGKLSKDTRHLIKTKLMDLVDTCRELGYIA